MLKENKNFKVLIALFIVIIIVLAAGLAGNGITLFDIADFVFIKPATGIATYVHKRNTNIYHLYGMLKSKVALENENSKLKEKINILNERIKLIQGVYEENGRLRNILNIKKQYAFKFIVGKVISDDIGNLNLLIINKGKDDGVKKMMPVTCTYDGKEVNLVGIVIDTSPHFSKVLITTDPHFNVGIRDIQTGEIGVAKGNGKSLYIISKISTPKINNNDLVATTGISDIYPENIIVGRVTTVQKKNSITTEVTVEPFIDFDTLSDVMIIYKK